NDSIYFVLVRLRPNDTCDSLDFRSYVRHDLSKIVLTTTITSCSPEIIIARHDDFRCSCLSKTRCKLRILSELLTNEKLHNLCFYIVPIGTNITSATTNTACSFNIFSLSNIFSDITIMKLRGLKCMLDRWVCDSVNGYIRNIIVTHPVDITNYNLTVHSYSSSLFEIRSWLIFSPLSFAALYL